MKDLWLLKSSKEEENWVSWKKDTLCIKKTKKQQVLDISTFQNLKKKGAPKKQVVSISFYTWNNPRKREIQRRAVALPGMW